MYIHFNTSKGKKHSKFLGVRLTDICVTQGIHQQICPFCTCSYWSQSSSLSSVMHLQLNIFNFFF